MEDHRCLWFGTRDTATSACVGANFKHMWARPDKPVRRGAACWLSRPCGGLTAGAGEESAGKRGLGRWSRASATGKCAHWVRGAPQGLVGRRKEEAGGLRDR